MEIGERLRRAGGSAEELATALYDRASDVLLALLDNPRLTEEHLKVLLSRKDLSHEFLREVGIRARLLRPYAVKVALARHPRVPRNVALGLVRQLYLFDLARLAAQPSAPAELRRLAEEAVISRLTGLSLGERLALARQATARVASAMLADKEERVYRAALENPRLREEGVVRALGNERLSASVVEAIAAHPRWSFRYDVRLGLIRHPHTSLARVLALVSEVRMADLAVLVEDRCMPGERRQYLARLVQAHGRRSLQRGRGRERARAAGAGAPPA